MRKTILGVIVLIFTYEVLSPSTALATANVCQASTSQSLRDCFTKLNSNLVDTVEITTEIVCSGDRTCELPPITVNHPVSIYGTPNSNAGIKRIDHYDYNIILFNQSTQTTISNLVFDDTQNKFCNGTSCYGVQIALLGGSNYVFDGITIKNSQYIGLEIGNANDVTIKNSKFLNMGMIAVWTGDNPIHAIIENNVFQDNFSNAILATFKGTATDPSIIRNNYFINNHRQAVFSVCGSGTDPCPGGQVLIAGNTNNLVVSNNTIKDGSLPIGTTGIELNGNTSNVTIQNNDIHHNTGAGIFLNRDSGNISNLNIVNNMIYGNNGPNVYAPGANISGNCESADCNPTAGAIITPTPTPILSPTPTPSYLSGDINHDGKVDIFDYNLLVTDFGKTGGSGFSPADLNADGKIDIFDYNILVTNFGKSQ